MPPLSFSDFTGLPTGEVNRRLLEEGYNETPSRERKNLPDIIGEVIREPMFLLLVGAGLISFVLGDVEEGAILLSFAVVVIGITAYQEQKTENALEALRNLSSPRALVIRDGSLRRVAGREVVTGGTLFFLAVAVALPVAREVFRFAGFGPMDLAVCILAGILPVLWFEVYKLARPGGGRGHPGPLRP